MNDNLRAQPTWQGAHHLSLVTPDLDATVRFYHGLLAMPLWAALGPRPYHGRHCFFKAGHFLIHFFEQPEAKTDFYYCFFTCFAPVRLLFSRPSLDIWLWS